MHKHWIGITWLVFAGLGSSGCRLFDTPDSENTVGRGASAFDPYLGGVSSAVRLSLHVHKGCGLLPNMEPVGKGTNAGLTDYPECRFRPMGFPLLRFLEDPSFPPPTDPMPLVTGRDYFLDRLVLSEAETDVHMTPFEYPAWVQSLPPFDKLDWSGLSVIEDKHVPSGLVGYDGAWERNVNFGNAAWQLRTDDTFTLELLDSDQTVRASITYPRAALLAENHASHNTSLKWKVDPVGRPEYPGDKRDHPAAPPPPGVMTLPTARTSQFKIQIVTSTTPSQVLAVPDDLTGDGAIRITWSQLPDDPFYVPVRFTDPEDLPATCYSAADPTQRVACNFGLDIDATMSQPDNGKFYVPGETFFFTVQMKDGSGNLLHDPEFFPTWSEFNAGQSNGLIFGTAAGGFQLTDADIVNVFQVAGPRQAMTIKHELNQDTYFQLTGTEAIPGVGTEGQENFLSVPAILDVVPGGPNTVLPSTQVVTLPADAKPGTYNLIVKWTRAFMGERVSKAQILTFQVGQEEITSYPNQVGNCQICHRGVLSLDNVRHGIAVDHIESCKACHARNDFYKPRAGTQNLIHRVHMFSDAYPQNRNDCSICHLTKESATRPSLVACGGCHPSAHGDEYFDMDMTSEYSSVNKVTAYSNCAQACHNSDTLPTAHIYPDN